MKKAPLILILSLALISFGILIDRFIFSRTDSLKAVNCGESEVRSQTSATDELKQLRARLGGVTEQEIHDYLATNSAEEKLRKADEILAKMIQVFIADVGYRISNAELNKLGKPLTVSSVEKPIDTQPTPLPEPILEKPTITVKDSYHRPRLLVNQIKDDSQVKEFLQTISLNEFYQGLKSSKNLNEQQAHQLNGRYAGLINFTNGRPQLRAEMSFEGEARQGKLRGRSDILLTEVTTGKNISHSRGTGNLDKSYSTYEGAYIIDVGGDYLELYYFSALDQLSGYFLEIQKGDYKRTGNVQMQRL
jgi:hypothetical protein